MTILSIDTAITPHSVALAQKEKILNFSTLDIATQSENLFSEINSMLERAKLTYFDINTILCTIGPGSFTGIRIGIAATRGIKKALPKIEIYGFTTLEIIAYVKNKSINQKTKPFYVIINAFGNEFYAQKFDIKNNPESEIEIMPKNFFLDNKNNQTIVSNDKDIISLFNKNNIKIELVKYSAENIIEYYKAHPEKAKKVNPLYIKTPNIHHGALRKNK